MSYDDMDDYFHQKQLIGQNFKQFRELLGKSRKELENEANNSIIQEQRIKLLEKGTFLPDILFIQYFTEEYGLNITWLVKGIGPIFSKKGPKTPGDIYLKYRESEPGKKSRDKTKQVNQPDNLNESITLRQIKDKSLTQWSCETLNEWLIESLNQWDNDLKDKTSLIQPLSATKTTTFNRIISLNWTIPVRQKFQGEMIGSIKKMDLPSIIEINKEDLLILKFPDTTIQNPGMDKQKPNSQLPNYPMIICLLSLIKKEINEEIEPDQNEENP